MTPAIKVSKHRTPFVLCVAADDADLDLKHLKIYRVLPDPDGRKHGMIRVIDDSGEDYLYPVRYFKPLVLSASLRRLLPRGRKKLYAPTCTASSR